MKEIKTILQTYHQKKQEGHQMALAMVVGVAGSSYRRAGARMLIVENGEWVGGISGGCLEGDILKKARLVILENKAMTVTYDTSQEDAYQIGVGLGCHGVLDILITPLKDEIYNPIKTLQDIVNYRNKYILCTIIKNNSSINLQLGDTFCFWDNPISKQFGIDLELFIKQTQKSQIVEHCISKTENLQIFVEIIHPPIQLFIFGNQYDIYPLIEITTTLGWEVFLVGNLLKINKNTIKKLSGAYDLNHSLSAHIDERTALVLMAHDYNRDFHHLKNCLPTKAGYIGLLGPRKRGEKLLAELAAEGIFLSSEQEKKFHSPIGLDIGSNSPEEIAIAIVAEIQAFFSGRNGGALRDRVGAIHEEG